MKSFAVVMLAGIAGAAHAQTGAGPDPSDPQVRVPPVQYRSVFSEYQPYRDPEIANWREANEGVKEGSGHAPKRAAKPGAKPATEPAAREAKPPSGGHAGH